MTLENKNKLFAKFMNLEEEETLNNLWVFARKEFKDPFNLSNYQTEFYEKKELCYHFFWDWLIPVVEKCMEVQLFGTHNLIKDIQNALLNFNIEKTFDAVFIFISFYNEKITN